MRGRPRIRISHAPFVAPGTQLDVAIELDFRSETPAEYISVNASGVRTVVLDASLSRREAEVIVAPFWREARRLEGHVYQPGMHAHEVSFAIPADAPLSHRGYGVSTTYTVEVLVSIPMWPDAVAKFPLQVVSPPTPPYLPQPAVFSERLPEGPLGIELSVDTTDVCIDEALSGRVVIHDLGARRCRGVEVTLIEVDYLHSPSLARPSFRWGQRIWNGTPPLGDPMPFSLIVPHVMSPSRSMPVYDVRHVLEVKCDLSFGANLSLRAPLVVRAPLAAPREKPAQLVRPIGDQRLDRVFAAAAGRTTLDFDPHMRALIGKAGGVLFMINQDSRGVSYLLAKYMFPDLDLGFSLEPRRAVDIRSPASPLLPGYVASYRDAAQIAPLLRCAEKLAARVEEIHLSDANAVIATRGSAATVDELLTFVAVAQDFAEGWARAIIEVPPPGSMAAHEAAWADYASRNRAAFGRSTMRIDGVRVGQDTLSIRTHFASNHAPQETIFTLLFEPALGDATEIDRASPSFSMQARALANALVSSRDARITGEKIEVVVPGAVADPDSHAGLVQEMAMVAAALHGRATAYR